MSVPVEQFDDLKYLGGVYVQMDAQFNRTDYSETLKHWFPTLYKSLEQHFDARQSPSGQSWPEWAFRPLSAPSDHPTVEISGRLRKSRTGGSEHIEEVDARSATVGTEVPYAGIHQEGASFALGIPLISRDCRRYLPEGTMIRIPPRPFMGIDEPSLDELCERVADKVVDQLKLKI